VTGSFPTGEVFFPGDCLPALRKMVYALKKIIHSLNLDNKGELPVLFIIGFDKGFVIY
jgi:hypothetical protein